MNIEQVRQAMSETPKGCNIIVEWVRNGKVRKGVTSNIQKSVRMVGRIGIEYDNMQTVQTKRATGELPAENAGLPWGRYEVYPYLIEHKGERYLRLYKGTSNKTTPRVVWFKDGSEVQRDEVADMLLKSELDSKEGDCFTVKVSDITRLNSEVLTDTEQVRTEAEQTPELVN